MTRYPITEKDMIRANVPRNFWRCSVENIPDEAPHKAHLSRYIENMEEHLTEGRGLLILGEFSTGKTGGSVAILKEALAIGKTALFVRERDLRGIFIDDSIFDSSDPDNTTFKQRIKNVDLLVLDDLGSSHGREFTIDIVESIYRWRYDDKKTTITSTNLSTDEIKNRFGLGIYEIIRAKSRGITFSGINWRDIENAETREKIT